MWIYRLVLFLDFGVFSLQPNVTRLRCTRTYDRFRSRFTAPSWFSPPGIRLATTIRRQSPQKNRFCSRKKTFNNQLRRRDANCATLLMTRNNYNRLQARKSVCTKFPPFRNIELTSAREYDTRKPTHTHKKCVYIYIYYKRILL